MMAVRVNDRDVKWEPGERRQRVDGGDGKALDRWEASSTHDHFTPSLFFTHPAVRLWPP